MRPTRAQGRSWSDRRQGRSSLRPENNPLRTWRRCWRPMTLADQPAITTTELLEALQGARKGRRPSWPCAPSTGVWDRFRAARRARTDVGCSLVSAVPSMIDLRQGFAGLRDLGAIVVLALAIAAVVRSVTGGQLSSSPDPPALPDRPVPLGVSPSLGRATAHVVLVEFADFQCPHCGAFARDAFPDIRARYVDTGVIQFVFRFLPLPIHPGPPGC
jgi:Thioredoxin